MWEWRVFGPPDELPAVELGPLASFEEREDLYVLIEDAVGFKVRARGGDPRCEVKRCFELDGAGPRHWEKVFERRLPLDPAWSRELAERIGRSVAARALHGTEDVLGFLGARSISVKKKVAKAPWAPAHALERTELAIGVTRLATVCIEAPTRARCLEAGRALGLDRHEASSYPELLGRL